MKRFLSKFRRRMLPQAPAELGSNLAAAAQHLHSCAEPLGSSLVPNENDGEDRWKQNLHVLIGHLPPEVLVIIFQHDLSGPQYSANAWLGPRRAVRRVIMLSGVCSYWRQVVVETSSLWSLVPLFGRYPYLEPLTSLCMQRAKDSLLDIAIFCHSEFTGWDLIGGFAPQNHAHSIRSLWLLARTQEQLHAVLRFLSSDSPSSLLELSVTFSPFITPFSDISGPADLLPGSRGYSMTPRFINLIQQLHVLDLTFVNLDWKQYTFDRLCTLKLTGHHLLLSFDQPTHVLSTCPLLQTLAISKLFAFTDDAAVFTSSISLPNLRQLRLDSLGFPALRAILRAFSAGLYTIELLFHKEFDTLGIYQGAETEERVAELLALFPKFLNITTLGMSPILDPLGLVGWLPRVVHSLPNLNTLLLHNTTMDKYTISCLTPQSGDIQLAVPFPRITTLKLHNVRISAMQEFKDMVMSHPLERIEMKNCDFRLNFLPEGSQPFERCSANVFVAHLQHGSDFHNWLLKFIPNVSIIYGHVQEANYIGGF